MASSSVPPSVGLDGGEPAPAVAGWRWPFAAVFVVLVPMLLADSPIWLSVLTNASILSLVSLGVWVTFSIGRINIAQGAFAMIGGYTTAILATRYGVSFWLCLPLVGGRGPSRTLIGLPILRLRGVYFAMISLSLTEASSPSSMAARSPRARPASRHSAPLLLRRCHFICCPPACLFSAYGLATSPSRIGGSFVPCARMRTSPRASASTSPAIASSRSPSAGMGGLCGAFLADFQQNIYPATYRWNDSINFMLYCFLGGLDYVLGPVVGAFLLVFAFELLDALQRYQALLYGILMIAVMLWYRTGFLSPEHARVRNRP